VRELIDAVRKSIASENYYAALTQALTLPDICSRLEHPKEPSGNRYPKWFDKYLVQYSGSLSGKDCYALRCASTHEGSDNIEGQSKKENLDHFVFLSSKDPYKNPHKCLIQDCVIQGKKESFLQLQVSIFCEDICDAAERWLADISVDQKIMNEISKTIKIYPSGYVYKGCIQFGKRDD
jgi:hypothetical protein